MGKISQYNDVPVPKLSDMLIGTSVGLNEDDQVENQTYNFTLQQLLDLFVPNIPSNNLQGVLDNGNTATQDINLFGKITTTDIEVTNDATFNNAYFPENMYVPGLIFDETYESGTTGQVLSRTATGVKWISLPPIFTPNLQQVLNVGNIASTNIQLSATLFADAVDADDITSNTSLTVSGELVDGNGSSGLNNQVLTSTGSGKIQWQNLSAYTGVAPIIVNNSTKEISITQADATHSGYLSSTDWNTFDSKQDGLFGTGIVKSTAGVITYISDNSENWDSAYNDTITSAGVTGTTTKTLTLNQRDGGTITASWTDISTAPVTSVFGRTGDVVAQTGDYTTTQVTEGTNLYFTNARSRDAISSSATGLTYTSATGVFSLTTGYSIPTDLSQVDWTAAYNNMIVSASVTGTSTKTLTLTQQDGGTITANWTDATGAVTSVFGRTGDVVAQTGDYTTTQVTEGTNLYYLDSRARAAISLTTIGSSGPATYNSSTGVLNIPDYGGGLTGYVPYTGATGNVNLGEYGLTSGYVAFDLTPTGTPTGVSTMYWDTAYRTVSLIDGDGDTTLQIGQEERVLVHNSTGSTLNDGQVVYIAGSTGNLPSVALASAATESSSAVTIGVVTESIAHGSDGFVTVSGIVNRLNTLAFTKGDMLWLGTTPGTFTNVKPISPNHLVLIGYVVKRAGGNGSILVKIQNTQELNECSDVLFDIPEVDGQVLSLQTVSGTQLWRNRTIPAILGYTPASLTSFSASSPLSYNNTTGLFSIQQATGSQSGYLSSTDWNTFNNKQPAGNYLTPTNIIGASPITASILGGDVHIGIPAANGTTNGYLSSSDWNTFNSKQSTISLTTTGSSGASTLISNTLNIPTYTLAGLGGVPTSRTITINGTTQDLSANRTFNVGTVTNVTAISPLSSTGGNTPVISIPAATSTSDGYLSSTDWNTFNNKQNALTNPVIGTGTSGYVTKFSGTSSVANSVIYESGGNIGINTTSPSTILDIRGNNGMAIRFLETSTGNSNRIQFGTGSGFGYIDATAGAGSTALVLQVASTERMRITDSGYVGIGNSAPSYQLHLSLDSAAKPSTNTWTIASDKRVKENINPYTKGLETILAINPVTYDYNGKAGFEKIEGNIGVIAQEIKDILPEGISTFKAKLNEEDEEETELINFNSHALTYVLINAVKELKAEIEELKKQIK